MMYIIIGFVFFFSSCIPCERTVECPFWYEFTLPFNVENLVDTISVGDTFQFTHSFPRFMVENENGQKYNLSGIAARYSQQVEINVMEFKGKNYYAGEKEAFSFIDIEDHGTVEPRPLGPAVIYRITFEEDEDGLFFKCNVVAHKSGVFGLALWSTLGLGGENIKNTIDTSCCQRNVTVGVDYLFNNGIGTNQEWLDDYPVMYSEGISPVEKAELLEEEVFLFYVKE